jgi:haloacetate dehalogenase
MRGYGQSDKPAIRPDHAQQCKRVVANDLLRLMRILGHDTFAVAGHDRGCYVALRMALDHPARVDRLIVMDGVPISEALNRCNAKFARDWYHWFFFAQPDKPERAIMADPNAWYGGSPEAMGAANFDEYRTAINNPATVTAMLEDYRAGLTIDREHEEADRRSGRKVRCPVLLVWSTRDSLPDLYGDPVAVWQPWVDHLTSAAINSGHHVTEENPDTLSSALVSFLRPPPPSDAIP